MPESQQLSQCSAERLREFQMVESVQRKACSEEVFNCIVTNSSGTVGERRVGNKEHIKTLM